MPRDWPNPPTSSSGLPRWTGRPRSGSCAITPTHCCAAGASRGMTSADTADLDLLRVSARKFLAERGAKQSVEDLAALDWTGLLVDEALGGAGWRPVETCVAAEAVASAPEDVRQRWLSDLLSGAVTAGVVGASIARVVGGDQVSVIVTLS